MRDQALGVAEIVGNRDDLERILQRKRRVLAALQLEADQRRAAGHLLGDDVGLRMVLAAGIDDLGDLGMVGEEIGDAAAFSVCWRTRSGSVSMPFRSVQALKGDMAGPVWRK